MFSTTTAITAALLLTSTTVNAIPIWSRIAALAVRAEPTTPAEIAQGSNFFFDSLHLEDSCTSGQISCISSQLAKCSLEGNWEITPCTGNNTCLAVPASDNTGVFVSCMLFADAQTLIGSDQVSVDFGVTSPPEATATAPVQATPTETETPSESAPTESASESSSESVPTESASESAPTESAPTESTPAEFAPTETSSDSAPAPTESADPTSTCTEEPEPTETEYETITVIIKPDPTLSGESTTITLFPTVTESAPVEPTESATETSPESAIVTEAPTATESAPTEPSATCTEEPTETEEPVEEPTESSSEELAPTDSISYSDISTEYGSAPTDSSSESAPTESASESASTTQETGQTLTVPPNFSVPTSAPTPVNAAPPSPSDVSVVGTHFIPAPVPSPARAKMVRVRRS